jgi:hypothetical protein
VPLFLLFFFLLLFLFLLFILYSLFFLTLRIFLFFLPLLWLLRCRGRRRLRGLRGLWRRFHGRGGCGRLVCHLHCCRIFAKTHQQISKIAKIQSIKRTKLMLGTMFNTL